MRRDIPGVTVSVLINEGPLISPFIDSFENLSLEEPLIFKP